MIFLIILEALISVAKGKKSNMADSVTNVNIGILMVLAGLGTYLLFKLENFNFYFKLGRHKGCVQSFVYELTRLKFTPDRDKPIDLLV